MPADYCIHCAERIVQEVDVCILIHGSRKHRETPGDDTSHSLGLISESWWCPTTSCFFYKPRERAKTLFHTGPPVSRVCVLMSDRSRGGGGADGNWNPIYLAKLTRAFCPSLSGIPLSPSSVRSPSSKSCKSYTDRKGEKEKDINCVVLPSYTFSISSSYKYLINVHICSAAT